jgi:DNA-binding transcriptional regulator GbsR (MarR family)
MASDPHDAAILRVADVVGGLMEAWGFKRNMGRMWAVMYLSPEPMSAAQLCDRLSLSTGAVSMTLGDLSKWGVVKKSWVPGERRDYYEPETSIWKMVSGVFRQRELQLIRSAIEAFDEAIEILEPSGKLTEFAVERIRGLLNLARIGENLLSGALTGKSIDASPLAGFKPK